jgi:hypothetical protein
MPASGLSGLSQWTAFRLQVCANSRLGARLSDEDAWHWFRIVTKEFAVLKRAVTVVLLLLGPAGCMTQETVPSKREGGPAYMQPGIGAPARQTDMFGNAFR